MSEYINKKKKYLTFHAVNKKFLEALPKQELSKMCQSLNMDTQGWGRERMAQRLYQFVGSEVRIDITDLPEYE